MRSALWPIWDPTGSTGGTALTPSVRTCSQAGTDVRQVSGAGAKRCSSREGRPRPSCHNAGQQPRPHKICPLYLKLHARHPPRAHSLAPHVQLCLKPTDGDDASEERRRCRWRLHQADDKWSQIGSSWRVCGAPEVTVSLCILLTCAF